MSGLQPPDGTKEIIEGVTEAIKQRLGSPLLFSFIAAWSYFNYKFLLVVFAEDPFKRKFEFIEQNIHMAVWLPFLAALLITVLVPLFEIPYRPFRTFCKNLEHGAVLWVEKRQPMDRDEQVLAFAEKDSTIDRLRTEITQLNANLANTVQLNYQKIEESNRKMGNTCLLYLGMGSGLSIDQIRYIISGSEPTDELINRLIAALRGNPMLPYLVAFTEFVAQQTGGAVVRIDLQELQRHVMVPDGLVQIYPDLLVAVGFLSPSAQIWGGFVTCPAGTSAYINAANFLRNAAA